MRRSSFFFLRLERKASEKAKEKKLNGTVDEHDENSNTSMASVNGHDTSGVVKEEITPKRNAERSAKVKVAKYGDDDDDDGVGEDEGNIRGMALEEGESDYMGSDSDTEKKLKKATAKPRKRKSGN